MRRHTLRTPLGVLFLVGATAAVAASAVMGSGAAGSSTTTLQPVADSYVRADNPTGNFGKASSLTIVGRPASIAYLRFRVTIPAGRIVDRATLQLLASSKSNARFTVHSVANTTWGENTTNYVNAPTIQDRVAASSGAPRGTRYVSVDVSSLVTRSGLVSLAVRGASASKLAFRSRESTSGRPRLVIQTFVADAGGAGSGGTGGAGSGGMGGAGSTDGIGSSGSTGEGGGTGGGGGTSGGGTSGGGGTGGGGASPVIAAAGDIACNSGTATAITCRHKETSDLLVNQGLAAVLPLGDIQYERGELGNFNAYYDPTWGRVKNITYPVPGNHEYATDNASGYFTYFSGRTSPPGYYSFDIGTWHLIALNSNCSAVGGCGASSPQVQWLRADLTAHPNACTLAYWHHPLFNSGADHGSDTTYTAFWQALYDANAEVVLVGHEHVYERFAPQTASGALDQARGIRQFTVGTGGKNHYPFGAIVANSQVRNDDTFGVLKIALNPGSYDWQFVPESGKTFTDIGSTPCH